MHHFTTTRHCVPQRALLVGFFLAFGSLALAQPKLDKAQLEQIEAMERQVLYHPHLYGKEHLKQFQSRGGKRIDYKTAQGEQTAWLIPPAQGATPERLWVFCGGNGTLGLDMEPIARDAGFANDAFLFVDYPGYGGLCSGQPCPKTIRESVRQSILAAAKALKIESVGLPDRVCVFGHSLGCAVALMAVEEFHLRAAVLCAPFTSTAEVAHAKFGIPKTFPFQHAFDNRPGLEELTKNHGRAWIIHGEKDSILPVIMSETLEREFKGTVDLHVIPGGEHNDIFVRGKKELYESMREARKLTPRDKNG
jgi:pimeloyl-ACP methyl ester carboxylesterase